MCKKSTYEWLSNELFVPKKQSPIWIDGSWYSGDISVETDNGVARGDFNVRYHGPDEIAELRIFGHCVDIFKNVR